MDAIEYQYHYDTLSELDPDTLVNDLGLSSEDILARFPTEVRRYIEENYG